MAVVWATFQTNVFQPLWVALFWFGSRSAQRRTHTLETGSSPRGYLPPVLTREAIIGDQLRARGGCRAVAAAEREEYNLKAFKDFHLKNGSRQGQNLALTVLVVPCLVE